LVERFFNGLPPALYWQERDHWRDFGLAAAGVSAMGGPRF
jgi:hypothetical protein